MKKMYEYQRFIYYKVKHVTRAVTEQYFIYEPDI